MSYDWDFTAFIPYWDSFLRGAWVTIELSVLSSVIGTLLGVCTAFLLRLHVVGRVFIALNDVMRAVPLLVLLFFFYYFPYSEVLGIAPPSAYVASLMALTLAQLNFTADIVRAGIDAVPKGAVLGARALGLKEPTIWWNVVLPDVMRQIMPTLMAFYIGNIKLSSLASVIGTEETVFVARTAMGQTFRSLEAWVIVALIYVAIVVPCTLTAARVEKSNWMQRR